MDVALTVIAALIMLIIAGAVVWKVLIPIVFGLLGYQLVTIHSFWTSKNPLKWVGFGIWAVGMWVSWEYSSNELEAACPGGGDDCSPFDYVYSTKSGIDLFWEMLFFSILLTGLAVWITTVLTDRTKAYVDQQDRTDL